jgi:hypothetical protein
MTLANIVVVVYDLTFKNSCCVDRLFVCLFIFSMATRKDEKPTCCGIDAELSCSRCWDGQGNDRESTFVVECASKIHVVKMPFF